jgi:hypothetical protein
LPVQKLLGHTLFSGIVPSDYIGVFWQTEISSADNAHERHSKKIPMNVFFGALLLVTTDNSHAAVQSLFASFLCVPSFGLLPLGDLDFVA